MKHSSVLGLLHAWHDNNLEDRRLWSVEMITDGGRDGTDWALRR
jgi:hypothetical protein